MKKNSNVNTFFLKELMKKDLKQKYTGSYLGVIWMFVNPIITILLYWIVFQFIMKQNSVEGIPYILWVASGLLPWFFYLDISTSGTVAIIDYKHIVSKISFDLRYLHKVKLVTALVAHMGFMAIVLVFIAAYGYLSIYAVQLVYYLACLLFFSYGLVKFTSTLMVFMRDIFQFVTVINQFLFWATPIFWSMSMVDITLGKILMLNPIAYIVEGYRNALVYHRWFFEDMGSTIVFWIISGGLFWVSNFVFNRLKKHFADVL